MVPADRELFRTLSLVMCLLNNGDASSFEFPFLAEVFDCHDYLRDTTLAHWPLTQRGAGIDFDLTRNHRRCQCDRLPEV